MAVQLSSRDDQAGTRKPIEVMRAVSRHADREAMLRWYARNRARSAALFGLVGDDAYYARPIPDRHPLVFYEGHLPAFSFNTLVKRALGEPGIDARLEELFARGIDPPESGADPGVDRNAWPARETVRQFVAEADRRVTTALEHADLERPGHPLLERAEAAYSILEHEQMHQETLRYLCHRLPRAWKRRPEDYVPVTGGSPPAQEWIEIPAGRVALGVDPDSESFSWDNERPSYAADVPAFAIERHDTTNGAFLEFVDAGGYGDRRWWRAQDWEWVRREGIGHPPFWERIAGAWHWRGMFDTIALPPAWPVYVTLAEARAFARWRGARLPTEAEFQRAAYGSGARAARRYPWGDEPPSSRRGVFDFNSWDPRPAGSHPLGQSAWGVEDLVGNGWEWTASTFAPFPGFSPLPSYPEYSADFFDGEHFVMKGASPATARELIRPSFRNWFRPRYPHVYATFRCARGRAQA